MYFPRKIKGFCDGANVMHLTGLFALLKETFPDLEHVHCLAHQV